MKTILLHLCFVIAAFGACAQGLSQKDTRFMMDAYQCGMAKVRMGELTAVHAKSDSVKVLARKMIVDDTKINEELKALAVSKHVSLPDSLSKEGNANYNELQNLSGADFDRSYTRMMIAEHKKAIGLFKTEEDSGSDADVRNWVSLTIPVLKNHLMLAQDVSVDLDKSKSRNTTGSDKGSTLK